MNRTSRTPDPGPQAPDSLMRQVASLTGSGLVFIAALVAVLGGPYSYQPAPLLASAVVLLALVTLFLTLTGESDWAILPGIFLLLVMTMPLAGLTPGKRSLRRFPPATCDPGARSISVLAYWRFPVTRPATRCPEKDRSCASGSGAGFCSNCMSSAPR